MCPQRSRPDRLAGCFLPPVAIIPLVMPMLTPVPEANDFEPIMFLSIAILAAFADIAPWRPNRMLGRG